MSKREYTLPGSNNEDEEREWGLTALNTAKGLPGESSEHQPKNVEAFSYPSMVLDEPPWECYSGITSHRGSMVQLSVEKRGEP